MFQLNQWIKGGQNPHQAHCLAGVGGGNKFNLNKVYTNPIKQGKTTHEAKLNQKIFLGRVVSLTNARAVRQGGDKSAVACIKYKTTPPVKEVWLHSTI